ncbi:MAG: diaminopimelate decarboxylase [Thiomargarita sp.]|nr:diaminopimelate decarboxylase [Thiomargarita sp.]
MKYFETKNNTLIIGQVDILTLVKQYGTPLYVYDLEIIKQQYQALKTAIPESVNIFYAIKANPNPSICQFMHSLGMGAEVASAGELYVALKTGFAGKSIIYNGPGKTDEDIEYAIQNKVHIINIESLDELHRLNTIAEQQQRLVKICVRINPILSITQAKMQTGGGSQKLGVDEEQIETIIKTAVQLDWIRLLGIHIYIGSQILDEKLLLKSIENTLFIAKRLANEFDLPMRCINFGGGLGVPYEDSEPKFNVKQFGKGLAYVIEKVAQLFDLSKTQFILEPGRFLVSDAGIFLTKVINVKHSREKQYAIIDGGINHAFLPIRMNKKYATVIANKMDLPANHSITVGGPLCTSMDVFSNEVQLPEVEAGDIIGIFNSGAYGFSASLLYFLSAPMPAEVIIHNGKHFLARSRGKKEDFLLNTITNDNNYKDFI